MYKPPGQQHRHRPIRETAEVRRLQKQQRAQGRHMVRVFVGARIAHLKY